MLVGHRESVTESEIAGYNRQITEAAERSGPYYAEIVSGADPRWCIVQTVPGQDRIAMGHLVARGFGVYQPETTRRWKARGKDHKRRVALVPGYIFVFVWDVLKHARRINGCTGVVKIVTVAEKFITVSDAEIGHMQIEEAREEFGPQLYGDAAPKKKRRRRKHKSAVVERDVLTISVRGVLRDIKSLDDANRIGAFRKALGLA